MILVLVQYTFSSGHIATDAVPNIDQHPNPIIKEDLKAYKSLDDYSIIIYAHPVKQGDEKTVL